VAFTDTHCHLNFNSFNEDLADVLNRAWDAGLDRILIPGVDLETSQKAVELSEKFPNLYAAVGFHPNDANSWQSDSLRSLQSLAKNPKVVAIGEIGLDYYRNRSTPDNQCSILKEQLRLASDLELPVIVHNRQAIGDLLPILGSWQKTLSQNGSPLASRPGVLHSYSDDLSNGLIFCEKNFFIGISGPITFQNAPTRKEITSSLPLNKLLIETDSPFLSPHPYRGHRNEPAFVVYIAKMITTLHKCEPEIVENITTDNADQLFVWRNLF
jgi:TatD DNase family protein